MDGVRPYSSCVPVVEGCCLNGANACAERDLFPAANTPDSSNSADTVVTDGSFRGSAGTRGSAVATGHADAPTDIQQESGTTGPCMPDCCITGTFCCGDSCRENALAAALTCPAQAACCSNPLLPCFQAKPSMTPPTTTTSAMSPTSDAPPSSPASPSPMLTPVPTALDITPMLPPDSASPLPTIQSVSGPATTADGPLRSAPESASTPAAPQQRETACPDGCEPWWARCAGHSYQGPGCCTAGASCVFKNAGYSNCVPDQLDPICSLSGGPDGTVGRFCQCAGSDYFGPQRCSAGLECVPANVFYSQCRPVCEATRRTVKGFPAAAALLF